MKILFIIPPAEKKVVERVFGCSYQLYSQPEIPILYLASIVSEHDIEFKDFTIENGNFKRFIEDSDFDVYVFHSVLLSKKIDIKSAKMIRAVKGAIPIVFFGPEPTRIPEEYVFDESCFVMRGEPEFIFKNFIESIEKNKDLNKIKGLTYKKNNKLIQNKSFGIIKDVDKIPFPNRRIVEKYKDRFFNPKLPKKPYTVILTSRGCLFRCYFCVPNSISWARELEWKKYHKKQKPPVGLRSPENIIKEFREITKMGYKSVFIMDDMFLWKKERIKKVLNGIKNLKLEFGILSRSDFIDEEIAKLLKEAGCKFVAMGVESFNQQILNYIKKDLDVKTVYNSIEILKKVGIEPEINLMFGTCHLETKEDIKKSINKAIDLDVNYVLFSITTPFPGTELEFAARKNGWLLEEKFRNLTETLDPFTKSLLEYPNLRAKDLEDLQKYAKRRFYFRFKVIKKSLQNVKNFSDFVNIIKTGIKVLR